MFDGRGRGSRRTAHLVIGLLVAWGCSRKQNANAAEELLPAAPVAAVITAPLAGVAQHLSELFARAAQIPGGEQLEANRRIAAAQLGFDPLSKDGLSSAGLDPDKGAALALTTSDRPPAWVAAVPVSNQDTFAKTLDRLRERAGLTDRAEETRNGTRIVTFSRPGVAGRIAHGFVRGYAVVARGADPAAEVAGAAGRKAEQSLSTAERLRSAREDIGPQDLTVLAAEGTLAFRGAAARTLPGALPGETAIGITGTAAGVSAKVAYRARDDEVAKIRATLPGGAGALAALLPADAPVRMRLGLQPAEVLQQARRIPEIAQAMDALRAGGADPLRDIAPALAPGAAVAIGLSPTANLAALVDYGILDWRTRSPFDSLQLVAVAPVADEARLAAALESLAKALPKAGAQVQRIADGWQVRYPGGEGPRFGIATVSGRKVAWLAGGFGTREVGGILSQAKDPSSVPPVLSQDPGAAVRIDLGALAARVRSLPDSTYGRGPQAYVARSLVGQIIEPLSTLRVTAAAVPTDRGLRAEIDLAIAPAGQR
ncbi:MAG: hypothetical protein ACJ79V_15950 [Myxococcales bacterium]